MNVANVDKLEDWQKYVAVCFDEVKVKEGIVLTSMSAELSVLWTSEMLTMQFLSMRDSWMEIHLHSNSLSKSSVYGSWCFFQIVFPIYAQFATRDLSADQWYAKNFYLRLV